MTMTAYDIIARLKMAPDQYLQASAFIPRHIGELPLCTVRVEPLHFVQGLEEFRVPTKGARQLVNELNTIFATARTLTA